MILPIYSWRQRLENRGVVSQTGYYCNILFLNSAVGSLALTLKPKAQCAAADGLLHCGKMFGYNGDDVEWELIGQSIPTHIREPYSPGQAAFDAETSLTIFLSCR